MLKYTILVKNACISSVAHKLKINCSHCIDLRGNNCSIYYLFTR